MRFKKEWFLQDAACSEERQQIVESTWLIVRGGAIGCVRKRWTDSHRVQNAATRHGFSSSCSNGERLLASGKSGPAPNRGCRVCEVMDRKRSKARLDRDEPPQGGQLEIQSWSRGPSLVLLSERNTVGSSSTHGATTTNSHRGPFPLFDHRHR